MSKPRLFLAVLAAAATCAAGGALADTLGKVVKINRPQVQTFDEAGAMAGMVAAKDFKLPADVVAVGTGGRIGVKLKDKVVYLRGLDVQTEGLTAKCAPVQTAAREKGSTYAGTNMGLGAPCKKQ